MRDYLSIGCTPCDEECAQVGSENYRKRAIIECTRYIQLLRGIFGDEPEGARFSIKAFPHDFGSYHEVVIYFDDDNEEAIEYAFNVENNCPSTWEG